MAYTWNLEHDSILEHIASTDTLKYLFCSLPCAPHPRSPAQNGRYFAILSSTRLTKWPPFLYSSSSADRLEQNTELFLSGPGRPPPPADFHPVATSSGGLKLAPFPARKSLAAPVNYMTAEESAQMKDAVFALLDQFDSWVLKNQNYPDIYLCIEIPHSQYNASASSACIPSRTTTLSGNTCAPWKNLCS
jgi:hypothetical protein